MFRDEAVRLVPGVFVSLQKWNDFARRHKDGCGQVQPIGRFVGKSASRGHNVFDIELPDKTTRSFNCDWFEVVSPLEVLAGVLDNE